MQKGSGPESLASGDISTELRRVAPYLSELSAGEMADLADAISVASLAAGDVVVSEGSPGDSLFIVCRGRLTVTTTGVDGVPVAVGSLEEGDFFGEIAILRGRPRAATVTASTETICFEVGKAVWNRLESKHPRLRGLLENAIQARAAASAGAVVDDFRRRKVPVPKDRA